MARQKSPVTMLPRSMRIEEGVWQKAKRRAEVEGRTVSSVMSDLMEGYARGVYELPQVKTIKQFPTE